MEGRNWIDIEPGKHSLSEYEVVTHRKYIEKKMERFMSGELKENLQNPFAQSIHWSGDRWKACLSTRGGAKRRFQYCTEYSGTIVYLRALQGHSGRNLIDPSLQDNVVIPSKFFQHIYHIGCACSIFILSSVRD